ncbi:MAG TPA: hypothetical protein VFI11_15615 [Anaerolineales bacterium]|nr:hypothetical protein [Anaerolineales bacterium]
MKALQRLMRILRDPTWEGMVGLVALGSVCVAAVLVTNILSLRQDAVGQVASGILMWMGQVATLPLWAVLAISLLALFGLGSAILPAIRRKRPQADRAAPKSTMHKRWGVWWRYPTPDNWIGGPYCPVHRLEMEVEQPRSQSDWCFVFKCRGTEKDEPHTIKGPGADQVKRGGLRNEPDIHRDVMDRISAEIARREAMEREERRGRHG